MFFPRWLKLAHHRPLGRLGWLPTGVIAHKRPALLRGLCCFCAFAGPRIESGVTKGRLADEGEAIQCSECPRHSCALLPLTQLRLSPRRSGLRLVTLSRRERELRVTPHPIAPRPGKVRAKARNPLQMGEGPGHQPPSPCRRWAPAVTQATPCDARMSPGGHPAPLGARAGEGYLVTPPPFTLR